jgi:hypothetical protein
MRKPPSRKLSPLFTVALLTVVVWGAPAAADGYPSCPGEVFRVAVEHPGVWRQARVRAVECDAAPANGASSSYDYHSRLIRLRTGFGGAYNRLIAHELGHAWAFTRRVNLARYALIRGFEDYYGQISAIVEDYAETFAWALGEYDTLVRVSAPPPYSFQTTAGPPTLAQIAQLRKEHLLPRGD